MIKKLTYLFLMLIVGVTSSWATTTTVGNTDNTSEWWTAFSDYYKVEEGKQAHVTFTNYSDKAENFHNWVLITNVAGTERGGEGYAEYFALRNDNATWGTYSNESALKSDYNWDTFKDDMDGSTVDMYIYNDGGTIYTTASITTAAGKVYPYSYNSKCTGANDFTFFLTVEKAHLEDLNVEMDEKQGNPNWSINFSEIGSAYSLADKANATISAEVADGLGTVTLGGALDTRFGLAAGSSWIYRTGTKGLYSFNGSGKPFGVFNAKAGQLIVVNIDIAPSAVTNATLKMTNGNERVYEVTADGNVKFTVARYCTIYSITVSNDLYTWYAKASATDEVIASGACAKGESVTIAYPAYVVKDGLLYDADKDSNDNWYKMTFTPDAMDYVQTVNYTAGWTSSVIFDTEAEAVSGVTTTSKWAHRASNALIAYTNTDGADNYKDVTTIPAGKYTIFARGINANNATRACKFKVGDNVVYEFSIVNGTNVTGTSEVFTVDADATLSVSCTGSSTSGLDYFYVKEYEEIPVLSKTYNATCQERNFKVAGAKLYTVTSIANAQMTLDEVVSGEGVAGYPYLIKANEGENFKFAYTSLSKTDKAAGVNNFYGTFTTYYTQSPYEFVLNADGTAFEKAANGTKVEAGSCYVYFDKNNIDDVTAKANAITFVGDVTTTVNNVDANVDTNKSGKFLENGQIVIYKAGKKFNVAGAQMK